MENERRFVVRARGIIVDEGELLLVRHPHRPDALVLPGGHLEWGEEPYECLARELTEELGVLPTLGRLRYVHTYTDGATRQLFEFFIEVTNGKDYRHAKGYPGMATGEIAEVVWISGDSDAPILPASIARAWKDGTLLTGETRLIGGAR